MKATILGLILKNAINLGQLYVLPKINKGLSKLPGRPDQMWKTYCFCVVRILQSPFTAYNKTRTDLYERYR